MRLFVYTREGSEPQQSDYVVGIDPGVKTNGISILDKSNMSIDMEAFEEKGINVRSIL